MTEFLFGAYIALLVLYGFLYHKIYGIENHFHNVWRNINEVRWDVGRFERISLPEDGQGERVKGADAIVELFCKLDSRIKEIEQWKSNVQSIRIEERAYTS